MAKNNNGLESYLFNKITDGRNIFSAIYSLESYVSEVGLLDSDSPVFNIDNNGKIDKKIIIAENDLCLYIALNDKYNFTLINKVINVCKNRIRSLLQSDELISLNVYFKLKNAHCENNSFDLSYRPIHTARLIDLICMVSMLNVLMFDDNFEEGKRKLSDISKLIPHNFYGNIPSTNVDEIYHKWSYQYKKYINDISKHSKLYKETHKYRTEVCLDLKNFFPTISPYFIYLYFINKMSIIYRDNEDINILKKVLIKLLYFKLNKTCIEGWESIYYPENVNLKNYINQGLAQGLPQSFFFANFCMLEIKNIITREDLFPGDSYFYVDDSVIYIDELLDSSTFNSKIERANKAIADYFSQYNIRKVDSEIEKILGSDCSFKYKIEFHEEGKSFYNLIDEISKSETIINLSRQVSLASKVMYSLDEIDDSMSLAKLEAIDNVISKEIASMTADKDGNKVNLSTRLKLLKRFKKFFSYRKYLLNMKKEGIDINKFYENFLFYSKKDKFEVDCKKLKEWLDKNLIESFKPQYKLLIQKLSLHTAKKFRDKIQEFDTSIAKMDTKIKSNKTEYLYYKKDVSNYFKLKEIKIDHYGSLIQQFMSNFNSLIDSDRDIVIKKMKQVSNLKLLTRLFSKKGADKDCLFILKTSSEFQRRILNTLFSKMVGIIPSDNYCFLKTNGKKISYAEFRIFAYLRNKNFDINKFSNFLKFLDNKDVSNKMNIDIGLIDVLAKFIIHVKDPEYIDSLIITHRIVKGLWSNGSKFLNAYTLHNEEHAVTLVNKSLELIKRIDFFVLKHIDYYILFLACYLHDISMVIHPDLNQLSTFNSKNNCFIFELMYKMRKEVESFYCINSNTNHRLKAAGKLIVDVFNQVYSFFENDVRSNHVQNSSKYIKNRAGDLFSYLEKTLLSFVAKVSESHGYEALEVYGLKSQAKNDLVSLKYLMVLIRLADLLDVANDRVNYYLLKENFSYLSEVSKFHWISHLVTDGVSIDTTYEQREDEKSILEKVIIKFNLNIKQFVAIYRQKKCKECNCFIRGDNLELKINFEDNCGNATKNNHCNQSSCPLLCLWMVEKNQWLISELSALGKYLLSSNNSLITTKIEVHFCCSNDVMLDSDMFDSIKAYLKV